jgi:hypothetical protein
MASACGLPDGRILYLRFTAVYTGLAVAAIAITG